MYGTLFHMQVKAGQESKVLDLFKEWERDRRPKAKGAVSGLLMRPDGKPWQLVGVAVFSSKETYRANADAPEQDRWFRRLRELLVADPTWEDGEFVEGIMS